MWIEISILINIVFVIVMAVIDDFGEVVAFEFGAAGTSDLADLPPLHHDDNWDLSPVGWGHGGGYLF